MSKAAKPDVQDPLYRYDSDHISVLDNEKPWNSNVKHFKRVQISALASMKMLKHALAGVEQGRAEGGTSFEVMGLMVGKPEGDSIIVMDAFPLPVKGTENFVLADSPEIQAYMIDLSEALELVRPERFVGWYHSHPFDVDGTTHCFLSATDVSTQFQWQRSLDPWIAVVVDPLRSLARQEPDIQAFRCYPVSHNPPPSECPDGTTADEETKTLRWGKAANRYYQLQVSYFMSKLGSKLLSIMARNHLWIRVLAATPSAQPENRQGLSDRMDGVARSLQQSESQVGSSRFYASSSSSASKPGSALSKAHQAATELAIEQSQGQASLVVKDMLFNFQQQ
eukprot:TRINITY_DN1976_c0_g1_i1.p1 TRINITY_DN1976_c0_g1~~TRINITY_DN1976_c0_g1_i1.p1  ORF type:complete len:337 (+),score=82.47 TRINITY_DN1976_c0_g1_i1:55-1065(+)